LGPNGIDDLGFYDVTIKNGVIRNFDDGVFVFGGVADVSISNVVATGNVRGGIVVNGDRVSIRNSAASGNGTVGIQAWGKVSVKSTTAAGNGSHGIWLIGEGSSVRSSSAFGNASTGFVFHGDSTSATSSTTSGNGGRGLYVEGNDASVKSTKASGNGGIGISVSGDAAVLSGNRADANGFAGGVSDGVGDGIVVDTFATAPMGTNVARGNDDSTECQPSSLCPVSTKAKAGLPISSCGQVATANAVLTQDLNCAGTGIWVGAPGITIDLNGHVLKGNDTDVGIRDLSFDDITIKNGVIRNFAYGVVILNDHDHVTVSNVVASGNTNEGIYVDGASAKIVSSTASGNGQSGIDLPGDSGSITSSTAAGNGLYGMWVSGDASSVKSSGAFGNAQTGIYVSGEQNSVTSSTTSGNGARGILAVGGQASVKSTKASGNSSNGIEVIGDTATVAGNRAEANGFPGGASDGAGLGIENTGFTTLPVGTNIVRGNDNSAECFPATLC
jgi:hypothetical protein